MIRDEDLGWVVSEDITIGVHVREIPAEQHSDYLRTWWIDVQTYGHRAWESPPAFTDTMVKVIEIPKCPHGLPAHECEPCMVASDFLHDAAREQRLMK